MLRWRICKRPTMKPNALSVFPNPIGSKFRLFTADGVRATVLGIWDSAGHEMAFPKSTVENEVDISNLPSGIYLLHAEVNGNEIVKKLIKRAA